MFNYLDVTVARSETSVFYLSVPPWEVAVLAAVNGGDVTNVVGKRAVRRELPNAQAEYDRLATKYGKGDGGEQDIVGLVYGVGARGVQALAAEIEKARGEAPAPKPVVPPEEDPLTGLDLDGEDEPFSAQAIDE